MSRTEMRITKRRMMATPISLAEVPRPSEGAEVLYAIDARQKLQTAIENEKRKRVAAEIEFARSVSKQISNSQVVNVDAISQRNAAEKAAAERARLRFEALEEVLAKVNKRIQQLKCESPYGVNAALTRKIGALEKVLSDKEHAEKDLEAEISALKAELVKLPKALLKKAGSSD